MAQDPKKISPLGLSLPALILTLLVALVYWPGLKGPFFFDDAPNITDNKQVTITEINSESLLSAAFSVKAGPLYRPFSMISFAVNHAWFGLDPFSYKLVNLVIHLCSTLALYWIACLLLELAPSGLNVTPQAKRYAPLIITALWALHPLNISSVLYVVQRMNSLSALFQFLALGSYLQGRIWLVSASPNPLSKVLVWWLVAALIFLPIAVFSKENALLFPLFLLAIETLWLRWNATSQLQRRIMSLLRLVFWSIPLIIGVLLIAGWEWILAGYAHRDFTLTQRLWTELIVLARYAKLILLPNTQWMSFYHDDILPVSDPLAQPTAILALFAWATVCAVAYKIRHSHPEITLAVAWFLAGHSMESSVIALELAHEHRNYIPTWGCAFAAGIALARFTFGGTRSAPRYLLLTCVVAVLAAATYVRASLWSNLHELVNYQARLNPESPRTNYAVGQLLFAEMLAVNNTEHSNAIYPEIIRRFEWVTQLDQNDFSGLLGMIRLNDQLEKPIPRQWIDETIQRVGRTALGQADVVHVQDFIHCQLNNLCHVNIITISEIIEALLANPTLPRGFTSTIRADYGLLLSINDITKRAGDVLMEAAILKPEWIDIRISAIVSLAQSGRTFHALLALFTIDPKHREEYSPQKLALFEQQAFRKTLLE